jgi:hypothetical protein
LSNKNLRFNIRNAYNVSLNEDVMFPLCFGGTAGFKYIQKANPNSKRI